MPEPADTITVRVITYGSTDVTYNTAAYRAALAADVLNVDLVGPLVTAVVIEPDGTLITPGQDDPPRASLLHSDGVTDAVATIIGRVRPLSSCSNCGEIAGACPRHVAEAIVDAVRQETLVIMPASEADQVLAHSRRLALCEAADHIEKTDPEASAWAVSVLRQRSDDSAPPVHAHTYGMSCPVNWCFWPRQGPNS